MPWKKMELRLTSPRYVQFRQTIKLRPASLLARRVSSPGWLWPQQPLANWIPRFQLNCWSQTIRKPTIDNLPIPWHTSKESSPHYLYKCKLPWEEIMSEGQELARYTPIDDTHITIVVAIPSRYDDALTRAGIVAERVTRSQKFADYQQMKAKNTQLRQQHDLQLFSTYLAQMQITRTADDLYTDAQAWQGMNAGLLEGFKAWMLKEGYAIGSINIRLATIRKYCELAHVSGVISAQELAMLKLVKGYRYSEGRNIDQDRKDRGLSTRVGTKKTAPTPVSTRQALRLKDETTKPLQPRTRAHDKLLETRDALLMCLMIEHALRVSEVVGLDASSINLEAGTITVYRQKTYTRDTYELMPRTREAAQAYLPLIDQDGPLFTSYQSKRITRYGIFERVRLLGKQVGIENLSPHDLRHFWTIDAFKNGNGIDLIQRYGGWNSPAM